MSLSGPPTFEQVETIDFIRAALSVLPRLRPNVAPLPINVGVADHDLHDEYCRIERVITDAHRIDILVRSVLLACEELLQETIEGGNSLSHRHWNQLQAAFRSTLRFLSGNLNAESIETRAAAWTSPSGNRSPSDPLRRWIRGHHVFLVLIQCVITSLNCFLSAYKAQEWRLSSFALDQVTTLFHGCSAALHFAGGFSPVAYEKQVRPSMMPPQAPPGMSGVLARDHDYLVRLLRSNKQIFTNIDSALREPYERFVSAFEDTYEAHKVVCARFVGDKRPSILSRNEQAEAAVDVLDKVKTMRLRSFHEF